MLRCNVKIWAIVVLICIITQFFTVSVPSISESFDQMDVVFEQKVAEEKAKAEALKAEKSEALVAGNVEDISHVLSEDESNDNEVTGTVVIEKVDDLNEKLDETDAEEDGEGKAVLSIILFFVFIILILGFILA
jgi:hypothetical protein